MKSSRWKVLLAAFGLFCAGLLVGGLVTAKVGLNLVRKAWLSPATSHGSADRAIDRIQKNLTKELTLDNVQAAAVQAELTRASGELKTLRVDTIQKAKADIIAATLRIAATLPPEKRPAFYQLSKARLARFGMELPAAAPAEQP